MKTNQELTETRKADRELMASRVADLVTSSGFQATVCDAIMGNGRRVEMKFPHGLALNVEFEGRRLMQRPNVFVLSWHFDTREHPNLSGRFPGEVSWLKHKATQVSRGFASMMFALESAIWSIRDGTAFEPAPSKATRESASESAGQVNLERISEPSPAHA